MQTKMAQTLETLNIESQIASYVSALSDKNKQVVLAVVKSIAEADHEAEFKKKWTKAIQLEKAREHTLNTVKKLFNDKNSLNKS